VQVVVRDRDHRRHGLGQVRAHPDRHHDLDQEVDRQCHGHRGHGTPEERAGQDAESEGERGVPDRCDPARAEHRRHDPRQVEDRAVGGLTRVDSTVDRLRPPRHGQTGNRARGLDVAGHLHA